MPDPDDAVIEDLIGFLRAEFDSEERAALLALKGYDDDGDPAAMPPALRESRWWSDYERLSVIADHKETPMCTVRGAGPHAAHHIFLHQPLRVLDDVAAKRRIVDELAELHGNADRSTDAVVRARYDALCHVVRVLGVPHSVIAGNPYPANPSYLDEWRPIGDAAPNHPRPTVWTEDKVRDVVFPHRRDEYRSGPGGADEPDVDETRHVYRRTTEPSPELLEQQEHQAAEAARAAGFDVHHQVDADTVRKIVEPEEEA